MAKRVTTSTTVEETSIIRNPNEFEEIIVNGCLIEPNTVYEVVSKEPSPTSPPVYIHLGSVKERIPGVGNTVSLSQQDSGFFSASPIFQKNELIKNDWNKRQELADKYYQIFAEPMRNYISEIERIKISTDNDFFDLNYPKGYFTVNIEEGVQFNTANPIDRFRLYIAIVEGELAMKGKREEEEKEVGLKDELDVYHQDAQFSYISITKKTSKKDQQAELEMEASYRFGDLLRTDKFLLVNMMNYLNIPVKSEISKPELNTLYKTKIEIDKKKIKDFIELLERFDTKPNELKTELDLLEKLKSKKGNEMIVKDGSSYYFEDRVLGSNLKSVVSNLMKPEYEDILKQFYLNFD